jgi:hypothetical protein
VLFANDPVLTNTTSTSRDNNLKRAKTHKILGVTFSTIGATSLAASVPFFINAANAAPSSVDVAISTAFGSILAVNGVIFGGISIPFHISSKKIRTSKSATLNLTNNSFSLAFEL